MKSIIKVVYVLLALSLALAACATQTPAPAAPASTEAQPAATEAQSAVVEEKPAETEAPAAATEAPAEPMEEKVLRLIFSQAPVTLNAHLANGNKDSEASRMILEPLAAYDESGQAVPVLAAEIPTIENGGIAADLLTTTWKLKQGVQWSDGSDFTADDVVFTWQYISNPVVGSPSAGSYTAIENIEAVDANTAVITWKQPTAEPLIAFSGLFGPVMQKAQFEPFNNESATQAEVNLAPVGTGPFMVSEFIPGDTVVYVKNPAYRDAENVYFDKVILKGGGEAASAALAVLQTGDYDFAWSIQLEKDVLDDIAANGKKGKVVSVPTSQTERLLFNHTNPDPSLGEQRSELGTEHPFLSDVRVREALTLAIDRGLLAERLWGALGIATCNVANPPYVTMQKLQWGDCNADMERAKALLDEAGWVDSNGNGFRDKDGVEMKILYQTTVNSLRQKTQEFVKAAWTELGVDVELKSVQASVFFSQDQANPDTSGKFYADVQQFAVGGMGTSTASRYLGNWRCDQIASSENNFSASNIERWCNEEYDALFQQFISEPDPAKRDEIGSMMNDLWVENFVGVPLIARANVNAVSNELLGTRISPLDVTVWNIAEWYK